MILAKYINPSDIFLTIFFVLWFYWLWNRRHIYAFALNFPGKIGLPFIGTVHQMKSVDYLLDSISDTFRECNENTLCTWWGTYPVLLTQDPIVVEKVLGSSNLITKANPFYKVMVRALGGGLVTSSGSEWRFHRKMINPVFNKNTLLKNFPVLNKAKNQLINKIGDRIKSNNCNEVHVDEILQRTMLGVTTETLMGQKLEKDETYIGKFFASYSLSFKKVAYLTFHAYINTYIIAKFNRSFSKALNTLQVLILENLAGRFQKQPHNQVTVDERAEDKQPILADQLYRLWRDGQFSWHDVVSEANTFMIASLDTTSNAVFAAIVMLATHPPVQKRLFEELTTVFHGNNIDVEYEHLSKLPYLKMVVHETLRVAPSVPLFARQVMENFEIFEGVTVPKGVQIVISPFHTHRNKDVWGPNADKFDPDNFLPERMSNRHSHAFIPFSRGLRNCIGFRSALFSIKVLLIGLVYNFEFDTDIKYEDLEWKAYVTLLFKREPPIKVRWREGRSLRY